MSQSAIEIKNVCKTFATHKALNNVSVEVKSGEFFSLLGPSGCGKTTLLRMIAGFEEPDSGEVFVGGANMGGVGPHKRPVNMVFQSYALFPHLTVFENVAFGLRLAKTAETQIKERVAQALDLVRLPAVGERFPRQLSGGQQQRVALARALVNKPAVLLLDEPLSALDPKIRQEMQAELARFKRELQMTFVMVTHDQTEAFGLSDRIAVMNAGRIEQVASPQEMFDNPKTAFVADFIGQTNLFHGKITRTQANKYLVDVGSGISIWATAGESVNIGDQVTIWLRTQSMHIAAEPVQSSEDNNCFAVEIVHRSFQGVTSDYSLKLSAQHSLVCTLENENHAVHEAGQKRFLVFSAAQAQIIKETQSADLQPVV